MITFKIHNTQFQKGSSDCGLFSIAYATDLAYGNDPASYRYDQTKLRSHFLECLEKEFLTPFPKQMVIPGRAKSEGISIYCSCRYPDNQWSREDGKMHEM